MKLLVLSDIHGNLPALEAVLGAEADFDAVAFCGDVVDYGPRPVECLRWVAEHTRFRVRGNPTTESNLSTHDGTGPPAEQGDLRMPWAERVRASRMRDIRTSGLKRGEETVSLSRPYSTNFLAWSPGGTPCARRGRVAPAILHGAKWHGRAGEKSGQDGQDLRDAILHVVKNARGPRSGSFGDFAWGKMARVRGWLHFVISWRGRRVAHRVTGVVGLLRRFCMGQNGTDAQEKSRQDGQDLRDAILHVVKNARGPRSGSFGDFARGKMARVRGWHRFVTRPGVEHRVPRPGSCTVQDRAEPGLL